ncbi:hypothetical protein HMPREF9943_00431 [Eggerthia catenaformis OT 569 = DSM 20559]|uniref:Calcineurin-like phosphoesterase domain-containing protein n=1 Tax=Eggerthia catenaformis OT 569 = DSM 20559 TaxID=999415 RepID=M2NGA4_9FIRM|nr:metallophosphoesterase [Eggerthia catenaformis]EMD17278.1 hypothetical protein HMPREF9943_00431 [Eggerthia catenaformis OT 569 = DSM 20559]
MNELDYLLYFYNYIYSDEPSIDRSFQVDYVQFDGFKNWLINHNIYIDAIMKINEAMFNLAKSAKSASKIEQLLHINLTEELLKIKHQYEHMIHVVFFKGNDDFPTFSIEKENVVFHYIENALDEHYLSLTDPSQPFLFGIFHADEYPGALIFTKDKQRFFKMNDENDISALSDLLDDPCLFEYKETGYSYYIHLSDTHFNSRKYKALECLYESLNILTSLIKTDHQLKVFITGDLMNTPNEKNMYMANDFMHTVKKHYHADVTFILGNHDMITAGLSMSTREKTKAIAYLLGEKIKILEDDKIILLKIDSNMSGNFARGRIGERQLAEIEYELSDVEHLEEYTIAALLHHHVYPVTKADFIKRKWNEKFIIGKLMDSSKSLIDSQKFIDWLEKHHIHYVFHGHKHVPFLLNKHNSYVISAGSATGTLKESESRYLSYNLLKYDYIKKQFVSCFIFYKDKKESKKLRIETYLMEEK